MTAGDIAKAAQAGTLSPRDAVVELALYVQAIEKGFAGRALDVAVPPPNEATLIANDGLQPGGP